MKTNKKPKNFAELFNSPDYKKLVKDKNLIKKLSAGDTDAVKQFKLYQKQQFGL
jgi:hypothetical protein